MNKHSQGSYLRGLKHLLQEANAQPKDNKSKPTANHTEKWTIFISSVAIIISVITGYFQFFYEKNDLRANFISATFQNDSTLVSTLIYQNKGNVYATVLGNAIVFYQDSTDIEHKSFQFSNDHGIQYYDEAFDPIVLTPGQQIHRNVGQFLDFKNMTRYNDLPIDPKLKIKLALAINYINENGFYSTNFIPVGWVLLDSAYHIDDFDVKYKTEILKSDTYYTGVNKVKNKR